MSIPDRARAGLQSSSAFRWRFWQRTELNLKDAEGTLDRLERMDPSPEQSAVLGMARAAAVPEAAPSERLAVLREAMETLTTRVAGDLCGLAAVALALRAHVPDQPVDEKLVGLLPDPGLLGQVSPDPAWLLHNAAQPAPRSGAEWASRLESCPRESVRKAVDGLCSQDVRGWLGELQDHPDLPALERAAVRQSDVSLAPHQWALGVPRPADAGGDLARWALGKSAEHPWKTLAEKLPGCEWTALERLDKPLDAREAAGLLAARPGAAAELAALCPSEAALALAAGLPEPSLGLREFAAGKNTRATLLRAVGETLEPAQVLERITTTDPLLGAVVAAPWPRAREHARLATAGYVASEQVGATPASVGLAMARSTDDVNEKLWVARAALSASECPARDTFLALTELEGTNAPWCRAALALSALRALERNPQAGSREVVEVMIEAGTSWASPAWRQAMSGAIAKQLAASDDPLAQALVRQPDLDPARLGELAAVLEDRILSQRPGSVAVGDRGGQVLVGGVRLDKRTVSAAPVEELIASEALPERVRAVPVLDPPPSEGEKVVAEWRDSYKSGIGGVYNPVTGEMEWRNAYKSGVAGAFEPETGQVEWREAYKSGVGVTRTSKGELEWHESYKSGVCGLEQPEGGMSWRESYKSGMGKCQRPDGTWEVRDSYKSGIAGRWDPVKGEIEWRDAYKSGIAYATNDPERPTLITTASIGMDYE